MSEEKSNAKEEQSTEVITASDTFTAVTSIGLCLALMAVKICIYWLVYLLTRSVFCMIFVAVCIALLQSAYVNAKIPDHGFLEKHDHIELIKQSNKIAPAIIMILLAVMVLLKVLVIYFR